MLAIARDDQRHGTRIADELAALGRRDQLVATSERAAALMAWCYLLDGRIDEVHALLDAAPAGPSVNVVRYSLALVEPGSGTPRPEPTGGLLDGMLYGIDYFRGRLGELAEDPADEVLLGVGHPADTAGAVHGAGVALREAMSRQRPVSIGA